MRDIEEHLDDIRDSGLYRRMRVVSGPQGPSVLVDGRPVLLLCSNNYLGLADHPRVREAAAEAAMRYGAGAGASRLVSGNMTIHRRLENQLADFKRAEACLLFGSGYLANSGVVSALAREGDVVFSDELNHASIVDGCRLARAETFVYDHADPDHLEWGLRQAEGRGSLIVTDGVFSMDGDIAPLEEIVELGLRYDARVMVDEAHGTGTLGPEGRGAVADAGLENEVDVIVGTLGKALGSYGAFVCCEQTMAKYLVNTARTLIFSTALPPPAVAAAMAALHLLREQPRRVEKLHRNADVLRDALASHGLSDRRLGDADRAPGDRGRRRGRAGQRARARDGRVRAGHPAADRARRHLAPAPGGHGVAHQDRAARGRGHPGRGGARLRAAAPPGRRPATRLARPCSTACSTSPDPRLRGLFVTGTDTGVGKSVVSAAVCAALTEGGERVAAFKPVVTGLDEPPGDWPPDHELLAAAAGGVRSARGGGPLPVRAGRVPALRGRDGRRDHRAGRARGGRAGRGRGGSAGGRGRGRAAGAAHHRATWCATWPWTWACRWWWPLERGSAPSTTRCSRWRPLGPPASHVCGIVMTPWLATPEPIEVSNVDTVSRLSRSSGHGPALDHARAPARGGLGAAAGRLALLSSIHGGGGGAEPERRSGEDRTMSSGPGDDMPELMRKLQERKVRHKQRHPVHRAGVVVLGVVLVLAGIVMSGPGVPGPGIATIIVGLTFLALEFDRAERLLERVVRWGERAAHRAENSSPRQRMAAGLAGALAVAAFIAAAVLWDIPLVPVL